MFRCNLLAYLSCSLNIVRFLLEGISGFTATSYRSPQSTSSHCAYNHSNHPNDSSDSSSFRHYLELIFTHFLEPTTLLCSHKTDVGLLWQVIGRVAMCAIRLVEKPYEDRLHYRIVLGRLRENKTILIIVYTVSSAPGYPNKIIPSRPHYFDLPNQSSINSLSKRKHI